MLTFMCNPVVSLVYASLLFAHRTTVFKSFLISSISNGGLIISTPASADNRFSIKKLTFPLTFGPKDLSICIELLLTAVSYTARTDVSGSIEYVSGIRFAP